MLESAFVGLWEGGGGVSEEIKLSPCWYAAAMFCAVPLCAIGLLVGAVALLAAWPFVPLVAYLDRKTEVSK